MMSSPDEGSQADRSLSSASRGQETDGLTVTPTSNQTSNGPATWSGSGRSQSPGMASLPSSSSASPAIASGSTTTTTKKASSSSTPKSDSVTLLTKDKIEQLAKSVDPNLKLDDDVQEFLQQYTNELVDEVATMSAKLAQARKSKTLDVQDVKYYLEHNWNMFIPGFGADAIKAKRKVPETEAHKNRQAIIKKHLKKF